MEQWTRVLIVVLFFIDINAFRLDVLDTIQGDECRHDVGILIHAVGNLQPWAIQMLDSNAKLQSGVLRGNIKNLGDYDECLNAQSPIPPQFCLVNVHVTSQNPKLDSFIEQATLGRRKWEITSINRTRILVPRYLPSMSLTQMGICLPSTCNSNDTETLLTGVLNQYLKPVGLDVSVDVGPEACSLAQESRTVHPLVAILFISILICVTIGTTLEVLQVESNTFALQLFLSFSVPKNWTSLTEGGGIPCLDGLRAISALWVILDHETIQVSLLPVTQKIKVVQAIQSIYHMPLMSFQSTDTFFALSGLLRALQLLKIFDRQAGMSANFFMQQVAQRYLRLTPAYMVMMMIYATVLPCLDSASTWNETVELPAQACRDNWFLNLLYVNNYFRTDNNSWYLAADFHFFLLSPFLMYLVWRLSAVLATALLISSMFITTAIPFAYTFHYGTPPVPHIAVSDLKLDQYLATVHRMTHHRAAPYIVGIAMGYLIHKIGSVKLNINKVYLAVGWTFTLMSVYYVMFGAFRIKQFDYEYQHLEVATYAAAHRTLWALAISWIIFTCQQGYGGWIDKFLSSKFWLPISRLSFGIFLTNAAVLLIGLGRSRTATFMDEYELFRSYSGDLAVILIASTAMFLFVEAPAGRLVSLLWPTGTRRVDVHDNGNLKISKNKKI